MIVHLPALAPHAPILNGGGPAGWPGGCIPPLRPVHGDPRDWTTPTEPVKPVHGDPRDWTTPTEPATPTGMPDHNCWDPRTWNTRIQLPAPDASVQANEAAALLV